MMRKVISAVIFWLTLFSGIIVWQWIDESDFRRLKQDGIRTTGRIAEISADDDQTVRYEFEAGAKLHATSGGVASIGKKAMEMNIGDVIPVYYLPDNPDISCVGSPEYGVSPLKMKILGAFSFASMVTLFSLLPFKAFSTSMFRTGSATNDGSSGSGRDS